MRACDRLFLLCERAVHAAGSGRSACLVLVQLVTIRSIKLLEGPTRLLAATLGSTLQTNADCEKEIKKRSKVDGWNECRKMIDSLTSCTRRLLYSHRWATVSDCRWLPYRRRRQRPRITKWNHKSRTKERSKNDFISFVLDPEELWYHFVILGYCLLCRCASALYHLNCSRNYKFTNIRTMQRCFKYRYRKGVYNVYALLE